MTVRYTLYQRHYTGVGLYRCDGGDLWREWPGFYAELMKRCAKECKDAMREFYAPLEAQFTLPADFNAQMNKIFDPWPSIRWKSSCRMCTPLLAWREWDVFICTYMNHCDVYGARMPNDSQHWVLTFRRSNSIRNVTMHTIRDAEFNSRSDLVAKIGKIAVSLIKSRMGPLLKEVSPLSLLPWEVDQKYEYGVPKDATVVQIKKEGNGYLYHIPGRVNDEGQEQWCRAFPWFGKEIVRV